LGDYLWITGMDRMHPLHYTLRRRYRSRWCGTVVLVRERAQSLRMGSLSCGMIWSFSGPSKASSLVKSREWITGSPRYLSGRLLVGYKVDTEMHRQEAEGVISSALSWLWPSLRCVARHAREEGLFKFFFNVPFYERNFKFFITNYGLPCL
jgi:hypothetical protein